MKTIGTADVTLVKENEDGLHAIQAGIYNAEKLHAIQAGIYNAEKLHPDYEEQDDRQS